MTLSRRTTLGLGAAATTALATPTHARILPPPAVMVTTWISGQVANEAGWAVYEAGGSPLDMAEAGAKTAEADPANTSVGYGGLPDREGRVTLDSVVMDHKGGLGAVAALEDVVHACSVARAVMEKTPHTMLVGPGARAFAVDQGFPTQSLLTPETEAAWRRWLERSEYAPQANIENEGLKPGGPNNHDTIGVLARDFTGNLAGVCSTSGLAFKMRGRVGDSPICGAGLFVDNEVGAATATGVGEEVTRIAGTHRIVMSMARGLTPYDACREAIEHLARLRGPAIAGMQVAFIAINKEGQHGGFALLPGFTWWATLQDGSAQEYRAEYLFRE